MGRLQLARTLALVFAVFAVPPAACNSLVGGADPQLRPTDAGNDLTSQEVGADDGSGPADGTEGGARCCSADGACSDPNTDPRNCGMCGHDCIGGGCANDLCTPMLLAGSPYAFRGLKSLYGLAVVGNTLYGTDWFMPLALIYSALPGVSLTAPNVVVPTEDGGDVGADALATDGQDLYWIVYCSGMGMSCTTSANWPTGIYRTTLPAGNAQRIVDAGFLQWIAVDANYLYYSYDGAAIVADKNGNTLGTFALTSPATPLFADGGKLLYLSGKALYVATPPAFADKAILSGSTTATAFTAHKGMGYWVDATTHRVYRRPLDRSLPMQDITPANGLALANYDYWMLLVDDHNVYAANWYYGSAKALGSLLMRFARDGSSSDATVLVSKQDGFGSLTQDDRAVYFTTYGSDSSPPPYAAIWMIAK